MSGLGPPSRFRETEPCQRATVAIQEGDGDDDITSDPLTV